jgi:hypothetical protein
MPCKVGFGEVRRLRVDRVAVDTGRVETERRKSGAPGLRAVREKDVVPDIAGCGIYAA